MRAACLAVLVALVLEVSCLSIFKSKEFKHCCKSLEPVRSNLPWKQIKSYYESDEKCDLKAYVVNFTRRNNVCLDANSENILRPLCLFEKNQNKKKSPKYKLLNTPKCEKYL